MQAQAHAVHNTLTMLVALCALLAVAGPVAWLQGQAELWACQQGCTPPHCCCKRCGGAAAAPHWGAHKGGLERAAGQQAVLTGVCTGQQPDQMKGVCAIAA